MRLRTVILRVTERSGWLWGAVCVAGFGCARGDVAGRGGPWPRHAARRRRIEKSNLLRQRIGRLPSAAADFSFNLRAHAYAREYNLYLVRQLREAEK